MRTVNLKNFLTIWDALALIISTAFLMIGITSIPNGFFCDEARIALTAYDLWTRVTDGFFNPFFYKHFSFAFGTLPVYFTLPFVATFGLTDWGARLSSVCGAVIALFFWLAIFRALNLKGRTLAVLAIATTPIYLHFSHILFGQFQTYPLVILALFLLLRAVQNPEAKYLAAASGICLGVTIYGAPSFVIGTNLLFTSLLGAHLFLRKHGKRIKYTGPFFTQNSNAGVRE